MSFVVETSSAVNFDDFLRENDNSIRSLWETNTSNPRFINALKSPLVARIFVKYCSCKLILKGCKIEKIFYLKDLQDKCCCFTVSTLDQQHLVLRVILLITLLETMKVFR